MKDTSKRRDEMQIQFEDGRELDIHPGSFIYFRDTSGSDSLFEWDDLSVEDQARFEKIEDDMSEKLSNLIH